MSSGLGLRRSPEMSGKIEKAGEVRRPAGSGPRPLPFAGSPASPGCAGLWVRREQK